MGFHVEDYLVKTSLLKGILFVWMFTYGADICIPRQESVFGGISLCEKALAPMYLYNVKR